MKPIKYTLCALVLLTYGYANAVNVGAITSTMNSDQDVISKEISNTVDSARLVTLCVERITSPMEGGKVVAMDSPQEVLSTPANMVLSGKGKDIFRIFYGGPKDDKERYYRLTWTDNPVVDEGITKTKKSAVATTSATISTILVVAPRQEKLDYKYENGIIRNTGNTSFRVVAFGPCKKETKEEDICRERYYVMPGIGVRLKFTDTTHGKAHVGIWHKENYITVK